MVRSVGIDPSSKTGFAALDDLGSLLRAKELTGVGSQDPKRMVTLIDEVIAHIRPDDAICIEGFAFNSGFGGKKSQSEDFQYGLGWGIRMALYRREIPFHVVAPNQLKKFVAVTGWIGEKGSKTKLKGKQLKQAVIDSVRKHYGFVHDNDNVNDAYVLARIAEAIREVRGGQEIESFPEYQQEVILAILSSAGMETPKRKRKTAARTRAAEPTLF